MQLLTALAPPASDDHPPALRLCASPEKYVGLLITAARDVAIAAHSAESGSCLRNALRLINDEGIPSASAQCPNDVIISPASSLLKNLEMESFRILAGRCWGDAAELDVIF